MGKNIIHCGDVGSGGIAKLCNNLALAISMIGTSEALGLVPEARCTFDYRSPLITVILLTIVPSYILNVCNTHQTSKKLCTMYMQGTRLGIDPQVLAKVGKARDLQ